MHIDPLLNVERDYARELSDADSPEKLVDLVMRYRMVAPDALAAIAPLQHDGAGKWFAEFRKGYLAYKRKKWPGIEWDKKYAAIVAPSMIEHIGMVAVVHDLPWGAVYCRMRLIGVIEERDGIAHFSPQVAHMVSCAGL